MSTEKKFGFATRQIHAGHMENAAGSLCAPIYQTSTFAFSTVQQGGARFAGEEGGYIYTRLGNPTLGAVEEKLASLEGGEAAMAAASGMGAISSALWTSVVAGDEIVADETLYGCTYALLNHGMTKFGVKVTLTDLSDIENLKKNLTDKTRVVYFETPCNPTLKLLDIELIAKTANAFNPDIRVIVDNTFCTPYLQRPLELGADVVVHSATKYLNGHGDVIGGVVVGSKEDMDRVRNSAMTRFCGTPLSPFNAYLVIRSMKTMGMRVRQHCTNAMAMAQYLEASPYVERVYYAGLESHPQHEVVARQMRDGLFTGMISFELRDGIHGLSAYDAGAKLLNHMHLAQIAVSLGDPDTLIEHPASMTHARVSKEDKEKAGISDGLIRLSVGLENVEDLMRDFDQAFAAL